MGHKAGTTDGAPGRDDGWGTRPGRRMGHKAGTTDGAQGRDDGWGVRPGLKAQKKRNMRLLIFRFWDFKLASIRL